MSDDVVLESVSREGDCWLASASFRSRSYPIAFKGDHAGKLRPLLPSPLALTTEGQEICALVDRIRKGAAIALPMIVIPNAFSTYVSAREIDWGISLGEVWVESAERTGDGQWLARLRLDAERQLYELKIWPGPLYETLREPRHPLFSSYEYDLMRLLRRMQEGEQLALPLQLRTRWPTPLDFPALPRPGRVNADPRSG